MQTNAAAQDRAVRKAQAGFAGKVEYIHDDQSSADWDGQ